MSPSAISTRSSAIRYVVSIFVLLCGVALLCPRDIRGKKAESVVRSTNTRGHLNSELVVDNQSGGVGRTKKKFPSFANGGGIIFFLHIPKTGGTTIRKNFQPTNNVNYFFGHHRKIYNSALPAIQRALRNESQQTVFVEAHANSSPSFMELRQNLTEWREEAAKNNVPVFFFTLLRDPLDYAISYFNFFNVQTTREREARFEQCNATVENFLRLIRNNPQCQFLYGGDKALLAPVQPADISKQSYSVVYDTLKSTMDWVGTTERLSDETLPLLSELTNTYSIEYQSFNVDQQVLREALKKEDLNASVVEAVSSYTSYDIALYNQFRLEFASTI